MNPEDLIALVTQTQAELGVSSHEDVRAEMLAEDRALEEAILTRQAALGNEDQATEGLATP